MKNRTFEDFDFCGIVCTSENSFTEIARKMYAYKK